MNMAAGDDETAAFEEFSNSGSVEVGATHKDDGGAAAPAGNSEAENSGGAAAAGADDQGDTGIEGTKDGEELDEGAEPKEGEDVKSEGYMKRLKRERAEARRDAREAKIRAETLENLVRAAGGTVPDTKTAGQPATVDATPRFAEPEPDPADQTKYPLGHLDPQYTRDLTRWNVRTAAQEQADTALQRQQESANRSQQEARQQRIQTQIQDLGARGSEIFDDYHEKVIDAGLKGEWKLSETTFDAAHSVEHGERILYALANDKVEAERVSKLSPIEQLRYVDAKNAEISKTTKPRTKPGAPPPPTARQPQGANSTTRINPATDDLDDFARAWSADEKGK